MSKKTAKIDVNNEVIVIDTGVVDTSPKKPSTISNEKTSTHTILVLDMSGSMAPQQKVTIEGINSFIYDQKEQVKKIGDEMYLTLILFNTKSNVAFESKRIEEVENITSELYQPNNGTALWDAVEMGVKLAKKSLDKGQNVSLVVDTDGEENASYVCVGDARNALIKDISEFDDATCKIVYLGASQDAWSNASTLGFNAASVANYSVNNQLGKYAAVSMANTAYRSCSTRGIQMDKSFVDTMSLADDDIKGVDINTVKPPITNNFKWQYLNPPQTIGKTVASNTYEAKSNTP